MARGAAEHFEHAVKYLLHRKRGEHEAHDLRDDHDAGSAEKALNARRQQQQNQDKEQDRVENAGKVMKEILNAPDSIPQSVLDKADCVVILPSVLKFAIGFGGSYGRGVMTCRGGKDFRGHWGAPSMIALEGGSAGLQLGGNATDFVLLLMSPRSATSILSSKVKLGGDASAAD